MGRRLVLFVVLALLATACRVDDVAISPVEGAQHSGPTDTASAATGQTGPTATTTQPAAAQLLQADYVDPGPGLPPSQRCGIDGPVTIGRIGLPVDLVVVGPTEHFNELAITQMQPDDPETVEKGILCVIVHDEDVGSVSCGYAELSTGMVELRRKPLVVTMVMILAESTDSPVAAPRLKIWQDCRSMSPIDPLEVPEPTDRPVEVTRALITAENLESYFDMVARFYVSQDPAEGPFSNEECAAITGVAEGQRAIGAAVLDALAIDHFWQELPEGHVPDPAKLGAITAQVDEYSSTVLNTVSSSDDKAVGIAQVAGLSNFLWSRVDAVNADHEQRDDPRFAAHIAWQVGGIASNGFDPYELASMLEVIVENRCTSIQLTESTGAWAARGDDSSEICADLATAYQARSRFRQAVEIDRSERRELGSYLNPAHSMLDNLRDLYPGSNANPFFSTDAFSAFYYAEYSLARRIDDGSAMRPDEVNGYEAEAAELHEFTRQNCPSITTVDLPSVFELEPVPDQAKVERVAAVFCSELTALLESRTIVRSVLDDQPGLQPFTAEVAKAMAEMRAHSQALEDLWAEDHVVLNPAGDIYPSLILSIYSSEVLVRQANFEPVEIPIPTEEPDADDGAWVVPFIDFVSETCPNIEAEQVAIAKHRSELPGPTFPAFPLFVGADHLCALTGRALEARTGHRDALRRKLEGDPYAFADAAAYESRFFGFVYLDLDDAFESTFPDAEYSVANSFRSVESELHRAAEDGSADRQYLQDALAMLPTFVQKVTSVCPSVDGAAFGTADETLALFDQFAGNRAELPAVLDVAATCALVDNSFRLRVAVRAAIEAQDADAANQASNAIYDPRLYDVELPEDFLRSWISALESSEGSLHSRIEYGTPQSSEDLARWDEAIDQMIGWIGANCPQNSIGLDLPSAAQVFPRPAQADIDEAQGDFCSAINDLFDARLEFRSYVGQPQDDFPDAAASAYRTILGSAARLWTQWEEAELLINPDGLSAHWRPGYDVAEVEALVRHAHFGPRRVPMLFSSRLEVPGYELGLFALAICDDVTDAVSAEITPLEGLAGPRYINPGSEISDAEHKQEYCTQLELALLLRAHFVTQLRAAVVDPGAAIEATSYFHRLDGIYWFSASDAFDDVRTDETIRSPSKYGMMAILARVAAGTTKFDDRWDLEDDLHEPEVMDPVVIEFCTEIPSDLFDLTIPDALQLFDALEGR